LIIDRKKKVRKRGKKWIANCIQEDLKDNRFSSCVDEKIWFAGLAYLTIPDIFYVEQLSHQ